MNLRDKLERYNPASSPTKTCPRRPGLPSSSYECDHKVCVFPPSHTHGACSVGALGERYPNAAGLLLRSSPDALISGRMAFLDTETTGLSGGAGTCAFLVGIGHWSADGFVVEQFLMRDFPAEQDMLEKASKLLRNFDVIVSYNGRAYDLPIMEGRLLLNGIRSKLGDRPHLDVLHPARRLWKHRLADCSLKSVERHALGYRRVGDIEGWMIPETFFKYLRSGERNLLEPILEHNRLDLLSLALITQLVLKAVDSPHDAPFGHGLDWYGLGTLFEQYRCPEEAVHCFRRAMSLGLPEEARGRCVKSLSLTYKREGEWRDAAQLWSCSLREPQADHAHRCFALEELAKFYEHRKGDLNAARETCQKAISILETKAALSGANVARELGRFEHRLRRIKRKIRKRNDA